MQFELNDIFKTDIPFWTLNKDDPFLKLYQNKNEEHIADLNISSDVANNLRGLVGKASTVELIVEIAGEPKKILFLGRMIDENQWEGYLCLPSSARLLAEKLIENNSFTETILAEVNSLVVVIDQNGFILKVGKYFEEFSGMKETDLIGRNAQELFMSKEQAAASLKNIASFYTENEGREIIRPIWIKGREYKIHWRNILIKDWASNKKYLICAGTDITEQIEANDRLKLLSNQDPLTKLWNRSAIEQIVKDKVLEKTPFSLVFLDFNEFKLVNDTHGHSVGDKLLVKFSERTKNISGFEQVSRIGGDEFLLLYTGAPSQLSETLDLLYDEFKEPILDKPSIRAKFSTGVVSYPENGNSYEDLFRRVDLAMYYAKRNGLKSAYAYEDNLEKEALKLSWLEENFQPALDNNEFFVVLQPKICLASKKICGSEALVRWKSSVKGSMVYPDEFIPFAEKYGYIEKLGLKVIELACKELSNFIKQGIYLPISVNISAKQFEHLSLIDNIFENLSKYCIPAELFQIELTETAVAKDADLVKQILRTLKSAGIKINLDDFGKGESSLFLLSDSDIDVLKIDKSFIDKIHTSKGYALLRGIVMAAKGLDLQVVAEGIETTEQSELVQKLGIDQGQGYLFSKPILPCDLMELCKINI